MNKKINISNRKSIDSPVIILVYITILFLAASITILLSFPGDYLEAFQRIIDAVINTLFFSFIPLCLAQVLVNTTSKAHGVSTTYRGVWCTGIILYTPLLVLGIVTDGVLWFGLMINPVLWIFHLLFFLSAFVIGLSTLPKGPAKRGVAKK